MSACRNISKPNKTCRTVLSSAKKNGPFSKCCLKNPRYLKKDTIYILHK